MNRKIELLEQSIGWDLTMRLVSNQDLGGFDAIVLMNLDLSTYNEMPHLSLMNLRDRILKQLLKIL